MAEEPTFGRRSWQKGIKTVTTDVERIAAEQAPIVARELQRIAKLDGTEADFRREAARILEEVGSAAGLTIVPRRVLCGPGPRGFPRPAYQSIGH